MTSAKQRRRELVVNLEEKASLTVNLDLLEVGERKENDEIITCKIAGFEVEMLIDSGASINAITDRVYNRLLSDRSSDRIFNIKVEATRSLLAYASKAPLVVMATIETDLWIDDHRPHGVEVFYVIQGAGRSLLGRDTAIRYNVLQLGRNVGIPVKGEDYSPDEVEWQVNAVATMSIVEQFPSFNLPPVKLNLDKSVAPLRSTYSSIPPGWREAANKRIQEMLLTGIIEKVSHGMDTSHCSSMLAVAKGKSDFRLVVDLRGPNKCIIREPHKMPTLDSILAKLDGCKWFSTIDLTNAFSHIVLDEESRHVTNFFTGEDFYRYKRLPFGLTNAPDIFQSSMELILHGCNGVMTYLDDSVIFAKTREEHDACLSMVMERLTQHGAKLNDKKCRFAVKTFIFLGFRFSANGYRVTDDRMEAIRNCRRPETIAEVRSFIGLMNFVDRFIPNRADKTRQMQELIRSHKFFWTTEMQAEFEFMKNEALHIIRTLGFFNRDHRTELVVDASPVGLGAVLAQYDLEDNPRIISCASKALTKTEKSYPQTQREALAVVWGAERFKFYLLGVSFTIVTDAEANEYIFGEGQRLGKRSVTRAEAWALRMAPFDFVVAHVPGHMNIADAFSRLINESRTDEAFDDAASDHELLAIEEALSPLSWMEIADASASDATLKAVRGCMRTEIWTPGLEKFQAIRKQLYTTGGVLVYRDKLVVPNCLQEKALSIAHRSHFGMVSMKRMIRDSLWWPGVSKDIETTVKNCDTCTRINRPSRPVPLSSRDLPEQPMQILQIDFLTLPGCGSEHFFVVTDTYSRMLWCIEMKRTDAKATSKALTDIFAIWGRAEILQSDGGPPFNSPSFTDDWHRNGVTHRKVVPYAPFMNGMVERHNEGIIKAVTAAQTESKDWRDAIQQYVTIYNNERPHSSTGITPFEMMTGRKYQGFFPSLSGLRNSRVDDEARDRDANAKFKAKRYADKKRRAIDSDIGTGDWVYVADKNRKNKLSPTYLKDCFQVINRVGPSVSVRNLDGVEYSRWVSDVVRVPGFKWNELSQEESTSESQSIEAGGSVNLPGVRRKSSSISETDESTIQPEVRPARARKVPSKFDYYHLYNVFG